MRAAVLGAGVIGLSTGIRLLERGHEVSILAKERTPHTTSDVAAAVYFPFKASPMHRIIPWARETYHVLAELASDPATGVTMMDVVAPLAHIESEPWWAGIAPAHRAARLHELPPGSACGWVLRAPTIEMPRYMRWLESRFLAAGGTIALREVTDLAAPAREHDVVVNCTGLGARTLADDPLVRPFRGQVVRLRDPGLGRAILDEATPRALAYTIPRSDGVVCGGTLEEDSWDTTPDPRTEAEIVRKAIEMEPRLVGCEVLGRAAGLRPYRSEVRLETEGHVVHNYGHGGSGVTVSWGCAAEATTLAENAAARRGLAPRAAR